VVRVPTYRFRGPGFDSWCYPDFLRSSGSVTGPTQPRECYSVSDVRQTERHSAEPLVLGLSRLDVEIASGNLEKYKPQVVIKFQQN
jgi:hypothetical protein